MSVQEAGWRAAVIEYIRREAQPVDKYGHQPRLYALTRAVGEGMSYDDDVVFVAVWMHDLGVFIGHRPEDPVALAAWDNVAYAIDRTPALLAKFGFPAEKIPAVIEAIRTHQPQMDPQSVEAMIVRDADILEQLGAVGIFERSAKLGATLAIRRFRRRCPVCARRWRRCLGCCDWSRPRCWPRGVRVLEEFLTAVEAEAETS